MRTLKLEQMKMKVNYQRCSTKEQNNARQVIQGMDRVFTDYCSGGIEFKKRDQASKLIKLIDWMVLNPKAIDNKLFGKYTYIYIYIYRGYIMSYESK